METSNYLDQWVTEVAQLTKAETSQEAAVHRGDIVTTVVTVLVTMGLKTMLPELKAWAKLGATALALKRQELQKKLEAWAQSKELDIPTAQKAAQQIADKVTEDNLKQLTEALEKEED